MNRNSIKYYTKNVWGNELIYVADPVQADLISYLTGKKTVTMQDLINIQELTGIGIERVFEPETAGVR